MSKEQSIYKSRCENGLYQWGLVRDVIHTKHENVIGFADLPQYLVQINSPLIVTF